MLGPNFSELLCPNELTERGSDCLLLNALIRSGLAAPAPNRAGPAGKRTDSKVKENQPPFSSRAHGSARGSVHPNRSTHPCRNVPGLSRERGQGVRGRRRVTRDVAELRHVSLYLPRGRGAEPGWVSPAVEVRFPNSQSTPRPGSVL